MTRLGAALLALAGLLAGCPVEDEFTFADCRTGYYLCLEYCENRCTAEDTTWDGARCQQCTEKCKRDGVECDDENRRREAN